MRSAGKPDILEAILAQKAQSF